MKGRDYIRIAGFILGFLLLNWVIGGLFYSWSRQSYDYEISRREFSAVQGQVSVVILGDSHARFSVMAAEIDGAYNLSSSGESYIFTYYKTRYYLERNNFHPQVAILPIDLHSFSSFQAERLEIQDPAFWGKYVNYAAFGWETGALMHMIPTIIKARFGIIGSLDETFEQMSSPRQENPIPLNSGDIPALDASSLQALENRQLKHAEKRARLYFKRSNYIDEIMLDYFYRLLDLLEAYDVQVVFVWYPVTDYYYDNVGEYIPVDSHLSTIEGLLADRQPALILDYHDLFFGHHEYFHDSDHLTMHGAEIFTQILIEDLTEAGVLPLEVN